MRSSAPPPSASASASRPAAAVTSPPAPVDCNDPGLAPPSAQVEALLTLFGQRQLDQAGALAQQLTERHPAWGFGFKALAITLQLRGEAEAALAAQLEAARLLPDDAEVWNNLGLVLTGLGQPAQAEAALQRAMALAPDYAEAHNNLAIAQYDQGKLGAAQAQLQRVLALRPDYVKAHNNLGLVLQAHSRMEEAVAAYRRALALQPHYADAYSNLLFCLSQAAGVDAGALAAEHAAYAERFEGPLRAHWPVHQNSRDPQRPLRIGIVSGDLRAHPVATFVEPVLAALARHDDLRLYAYSNYAAEDAVSARLRGHFAGWTRIAGCDDAAVAARIGADAIDVLVDLSGHTAHNRLPVFARKPAPVQASWIGYPGSTGLQAMDYYLTDPFMLPPGQFDEQFSEKLVYLPVSAPFLPSPLAPPVNPLPAQTRGYLTFGSFNRPSKLSEPVVALWARLLRTLPTARMLLAAMPADGDHAALVALFARHGVARERLLFHPRADMAAYLALHHEVDVCLDTFPYSGGTTTLHGLYMGVPTLTLEGATAAGRQGASILRHSALPQFVAASQDDFVAIGAALPQQLAALAAIRASLRGRFAAPSSADMDAIAAGVAAAWRAMWQRWCSALPPVALHIGKLP